MRICSTSMKEYTTLSVHFQDSENDRRATNLMSFARDWDCTLTMADRTSIEVRRDPAADSSLIDAIARLTVMKAVVDRCSVEDVQRAILEYVKGNVEVDAPMTDQKPYA